ncbi:hypothetical protein Alg130_11034, partial [Pyrenophora tritici-repentis]
HQAERADSPVSANPSEPSELLASAQLAEQANWLSSLSLLIDICANNSVGAPFKKRILDRKIDYGLSYSDHVSPYSDIYARLLEHGNEVVSHSTDAYTRTTALFSGIQVKAHDGNIFEAKYQLSIWMAASLRQKALLARRVGLPDTTCLVEPYFTFHGHVLGFHIAFMDTEQDAVHVQEFGSASSSSISGVFQQLKVWQNVIEYGVDESANGFWGGFLGPILARLADIE